MNGKKFMVGALCLGMILTGCGNMSNKAKGGLIGTAAGGAAGTGLGAAIGALVNGKKGAKIGSAIGAGVGVAAGATAGALIGKKMDKAAEQAAAIEGAQVEQVVDNNGLQAVKVTFDSGILYNTGSAELSSGAKASLSKFANNVLKLNADMDVDIYGYTDNQGWRNSTAAESQQKNLNLSQERAQSVSSYLMQCGAASSQIKTVQGKGEADPVADNATEAGRKENRRVEVYMYASQAMIQQAEAGTLQ